LIGNPDLLVLDEPLSGLDPQGVERMLRLFQTLVTEGKTVVLSSHHLREVEHVCTDVGLIDDGKTLIEGATADLLRQLNSILVVRTTELQAVKEKLQSQPTVGSIELIDGDLHCQIDSSFEPERVLASLSSTPVSEFFIRRASLVDVFQQEVGDA
jgi:ABC-2 type transport system ATP-binding protein